MLERTRREQATLLEAFRKIFLGVAGDVAQIENNGGTSHNKRKMISGYSLATSFGIILVAGILLAYYGGSYVDRWLGTAPWITLVLMILTMISAFHNLLRELRIKSKDDP